MGGVWMGCLPGRSFRMCLTENQVPVGCGEEEMGRVGTGMRDEEGSSRLNSLIGGGSDGVVMERLRVRVAPLTWTHRSWTP